jgi:hypothetical protein
MGCAGHNDREEPEDSGQQEGREGIRETRAAVANGDDDENNEYPFVIHYLAPAGGQCSAILITPTWVLTAAHCVLGDAKFGVSPTPDAYLTDFPITFDGSLIAQNGQLTFTHSISLGIDTPSPITSPGLGAALGAMYPGGGRPNPIKTRFVQPASFFPGKNDAYRDVALVQLDERVPLARLNPLHPPNNSPSNYVPGCRNLGEDFTGIVIGYGEKTFTQPEPDLMPRNANSSNGWQSECPGLLPNACGGEEFYYENNWTLLTPYEGSLPGDSGGALVRVREANSAGTNPGSYPFRLCGVNSFHQPNLLVPIILQPAWTAGVAAVDSFGNNENFLLANHVIDQNGRFMGECLPSELTGTTADDTDSDFDLIPDACDPCRLVPDPEYRFTGQLNLQPDFDGDGVPDICDLCPTSPTSQTDSDGDGLGNACDACGDSGVSDMVCCTVGAPGQCGKAGVCIASAVGSPGGCAEAGFTGRCSQAQDEDGDGIPNTCDNCPLDKNADKDGLGNPIPQFDSDGDGLGNVCDGCSGIHDPRFFPELEMLSQVNEADTGGLKKCTLVETGPNALAAGTNSCQQQTGKSTSRCVPHRLSNGTLEGVCTESVDDFDGDGVWDRCDNCRYVANPKQDNCNIEAEMVADPTRYPYVGDACDRTPCSYVRSLYNTANTSSAQFPESNGVGLLEVKPLLLPPNAQVGGIQPGAPPPPYSLSTNQNPQSTVGGSFCRCGDPNTGTYQPWECRSALFGTCTIDTSQYATTDSGTWLKPELRPNAVPEQPNLNPPVPDSELPALPTTNASEQSFAPLNQGTVSLVNWDTNTLTGGNSVLVGPGDALGKECQDGKGVQGVFWSSVRNVNNLNAPATSYTPLSSHYEFAEWGSPQACIKLFDPNDFKYQPCLFCDPNDLFQSMANFSIVINPADINERLLLVDDGKLSRVVGKMPVSIDDVALPASLPIAASDGFHTCQPGPDFVTVRTDGTRLTSAVESRKGGLFSLLPSRRVTEVDGLVAALGATPTAEVSASNPPPRQGAQMALSKRLGTLFLAGGENGAQTLKDLWRYDLSSQDWKAIELQGQSFGEVLAMTFHGPEGKLYVVDEKKLGWFRWGRILRIDPRTGVSEVLGAWPRVRAFEQLFLSVAESGDLVLSASQTKTKKGSHLVLVFATGSSGIEKVRWSVGGQGALAGPAMLTRNGLTRPFSSSSLQSKRFTPTSELPKKTSGKMGDCFLCEGGAGFWFRWPSGSGPLFPGGARAVPPPRSHPALLVLLRAVLGWQAVLARRGNPRQEPQAWRALPVLPVRQALLAKLVAMLDPRAIRA